MTHRHLFHTHQISEMDPRIWNHPLPAPHLQLGNGSFMLPMDSAANIVPRPNDYPPPFPDYAATNPGPLHNPYLHPSTTIGSCPFIPDQGQRVMPSSFNQHGSSMVNSQSEVVRTTSKRKSPAMPLAFDRGSTSGYYYAGSSSNLHNSSDSLQPKPMVGPERWPSDPTSMIPCYRTDNLSTAGEGSQRNVRSRHNHALHMEISPAAPYTLSNPARQFCSTGNISGLNMADQWSHTPMPIAPQGRILSSEGGLSYEMNRSFHGSNAINSTVGINGAYHTNLTQIRDPSALLPTLHGASQRGSGASSSSYTQRSNSYRVNSSYAPVGFAAVSLEDGGTSGTQSIASSRYSRPLSIVGRSSYRSGRTRNSSSRFQSIYDEDNSRSRWLSEGSVSIDRSSFYDSRNIFDQHRDMRLDIDNMSYEELLALEERIGNVSTGLSEANISACLIETSYCVPNQTEDDQEVNCVICLDAYRDSDNLGRLKCGHDFHVSCIKKWLQVKNACPICKATALSDA